MISPAGTSIASNDDEEEGEEEETADMDLLLGGVHLLNEAIAMRIEKDGDEFDPLDLTDEVYSLSLSLSLFFSLPLSLSFSLSFSFSLKEQF